MANFAYDSSKWDALSPDQLSLGPIAVGGDFSISARLCIPPTTPKGGNTLMIATHGIGFDKL